MTMLHTTVRAAAAALVALWLAAAGSALAASPVASAAAAWRPSIVSAAGFGADLRACQTALGGRLAQRRRVEAHHPRLAACLRQRGWSPDGTPSLDRLLAPG
jgi:hypothetical protein